MPARTRGPAATATTPTAAARGAGALPRRAPPVPAPAVAAPRGSARPRHSAPAAAGQAQQPPVDLFHKTRLCRFNELGLCARGEECSFAHSQGELHPMPDLTKTRLCQDLINTGTCTNERCAFAHNKTELRSRPSKKSILAARASRAAEASAAKHCSRAMSPMSPGAVAIAPVPAARAATAQQRAAAVGHGGPEAPPPPPYADLLGEATCDPTPGGHHRGDSETSTTTGGELSPREGWPAGPWQWAPPGPVGATSQAGQQCKPLADTEAHREDDCEGVQEDSTAESPAVEIEVKNTFVHMTLTPSSALLRRVHSWPEWCL